MSVEFVEVYIPFHHQYFQMVVILVHHFGRNMKNLNLSAKVQVPKTEVEKINTNKEVQKDARMRKIEEERRTDRHFI